VAHFGSVSEQDQIAAVVRRITRLLGGSLEMDLVEGEVRAAFRSWEDASVRDFVPIFAERRALAELATALTMSGAASGGRPT